MEYRKKLIVGAKKLGVELNEQQVEQFITYMDILQEWNKKINLSQFTINFT